MQNDAEVENEHWNLPSSKRSLFFCDASFCLVAAASPYKDCISRVLGLLNEHTGVSSGWTHVHEVFIYICVAKAPFMTTVWSYSFSVSGFSFCHFKLFSSDTLTRIKIKIPACEITRSMGVKKRKHLQESQATTNGKLQAWLLFLCRVCVVLSTHWLFNLMYIQS